MKKHILACAIVTGLVATAWPAASQPKVAEPTAEVGFVLYKLKTGKDSGLGQVVAQAGSAAIGGVIGTVIMTSTIVKASKLGALLGSAAGPVGFVVGAAAGAA